VVTGLDHVFTPGVAAPLPTFYQLVEFFRLRIE